MKKMFGYSEGEQHFKHHWLPDAAVNLSTDHVTIKVDNVQKYKRKKNVW